jgi:CRISPR-associated endonuclease Cas2
MPKKKKIRSLEVQLIDRVRLIKGAGIESPRLIGKIIPDHISEIDSFQSRIDTIISLLQSFNNKKTLNEMLCLIMYDIEHNKVRTHIGKYLLKKGCHRIQKSVFLGNLDRKIYEEIHKTLKDIQETYDNHDSIFFVPVGEDDLRSMRAVGKNIDFELVAGKKNTLFF